MDFLTNFKTTLWATAQIFLMAGCGYFLVKRKTIDHAGLVLLSKLMISLFFPLFTFHQLITHFSFTAYQNWWIFPLISFSVTAAGFLLGWFVARVAKVSPKKDFIALVGFQNSGFIPLMLVMNLLSGEPAQRLYIYIFLFLIGFDLVMWSFGVWFLTRHKAGKFELKNLIASPFTAIVLSLILIALGLNRFIPEVILKPVKMFGDCALPLAVMIVGGNLAMIDIFSVDKRKAALVTLTKLVLLPLLAFSFILAFKTYGLIGFLILLQACVPSANSLSVISRRHELEDKFLNQGIFFTNALSIFTLPFFLTFYRQLGLLNY
ncbi:MAG: AEC family transporter [Candidatus Omnitrophota bacterium]